MVEVPIAPVVVKVRRLLRDEARRKNLSFKAVVAKHYRTILRHPHVLDIEANTKAGNPPKSMTVDRLTYKHTKTLAAVATVMLAVELGLVP
ncbi:hypothetical protein [Lacipirellula sp.]|uniref:hypothetical protein n=1 Tax=Lacipirellula sp. TaxID=2691419 RepID=UPI003D106500